MSQHTSSATTMRTVSTEDLIALLLDLAHENPEACEQLLAEGEAMIAARKVRS